MQAPSVLKSVASEVVFESELITVWCYPELRLVSHQMHKVCHGTPFRDALRAGTAAMQRYGAISWLSDDRLNGPLPDDDEKWGTTTWFQATKAAGWKYWAIVLPEKAVPALTKLLNNPKEEDIVRISAAKGLGAMGPHAKTALKDLKGIIASDKKSKLGKEAKNAVAAITQKAK